MKILKLETFKLNLIQYNCGVIKYAIKCPGPLVCSHSCIYKILHRPPYNYQIGKIIKK